ncbi:unnamed protein product [Gongylonema pulchrum]|uniref:2-Hacid_dh_C domain-containing protein n=1 Tax=Gongylonema pulchrum TaxID=637853 RepID=A0A183DTR8_9BILA|nr:unnamed protein product [Gongylonema pulchrum]
MMMSSLQNSDSRPPSTNSASALPSSNGLVGGTRKRKAAIGCSAEAYFEEIFERYILNNWEITDGSGGVKTEGAAEHICALLLSLARKIPQSAVLMKEGKWMRSEPLAEDLFGKSLAIIGLGRTGVEVARRMQVFGMRTFGYDPQFTQDVCLAFKISRSCLITGDLICEIS